MIHPDDNEAHARRSHPAGRDRPDDEARRYGLHRPVEGEPWRYDQAPQKPAMDPWLTTIAATVIIVCLLAVVIAASVGFIRWAL